jgi:S1-C subfamily serine protease
MISHGRQRSLVKQLNTSAYRGRPSAGSGRVISVDTRGRCGDTYSLSLAPSAEGSQRSTKDSPPASMTYGRGMRFFAMLVVVATLVTGCAPSDSLPTPDIQATVKAAVQQALADRPTPTPAAPGIQATVKAAVQQALADRPTPTPAAVTKEPPDPYAIAAASVVRIETASRSGSGTMLGDSRHVVTNRHVIEGVSADELKVSHAREGEAPRVTGASVIYEAALWDLALLRLDDPLGPPIKVERKLPLIGDSIIIGGFPGVGGDTLTVTTGTVAGFDLGVSTRIKIDAAIFPGNSGGAALDSNGRLVGIPTTSATPEEGGGALGFLLSADLLRGALTEALLNDISGDKAAGDRPYPISVLGVPAVVTVPEGWDIVSAMGYLDARRPGSDPRAVDSEFRVFGVFALDLLPGESGEGVLDRLIQESSGAFALITRNDIDLPSGFTDTILVKTEERVELSDLETRTSVLGNWIADSGLITRFAAGHADGQAVIAFIESSSIGASRDADELLTRIQLLDD